MTLQEGYKIFLLKLALVSFLTVVLIFQEDFVFLTESPLLTLRWKFLTRADSRPKDVVIVEIDQVSLETYGRWPWKRATMAQLIDLLAAAHPKAIGIVILFPEPSDEVNDTALIRAIKGAKNVVLGYVKSQRIYPFFLQGVPSTSQTFDVGFLEFKLDSKGKAVGIPPVVYQNGEQHRAFPLVVAERFDMDHAAKAKSMGGVLRPNFYGPRGTFKRVSAVDVLSEKSIEQFKGKIVLVGAHLGLLFPSTAAGPMAADEVYATIVQNIIDANWLRFNWLINIVLCISGIIVFTALPSKKIALPLLTLIFLGIAYFVLVPKGIVASTITFVLSLLLGYYLERRSLQEHRGSA